MRYKIRIFFFNKIIRGEVFYQNGKMLGIFSTNILSFKIFYEPDTINSEHELFITQKELLSKKNIRMYVEGCGFRSSRNKKRLSIKVASDSL